MQIKQDLSRDEEKFKKAFNKNYGGRAGGWVSGTCPHGVIYTLHEVRVDANGRAVIDKQSQTQNRYETQKWGSKSETLSHDDGDNAGNNTNTEEVRWHTQASSLPGFRHMGSSQSAHDDGGQSPPNQPRTSRSNNHQSLQIQCTWGSKANLCHMMTWRQRPTKHVPNKAEATSCTSSLQIQGHYGIWTLIDVDTQRYQPPAKFSQTVSWIKDLGLKNRDKCLIKVVAYWLNDRIINAANETDDDRLDPNYGGLEDIIVLLKKDGFSIISPIGSGICPEMYKCTG
ncbi:hypothetical protein OS493_037075 [Desmophyllum pertusum]|uniref:Uncharacterized protein n=1 Tax=Desmophyllum pertusum TaxID=174260 RepID=A0A9W9Z6T1_9CNID|nr:hypothetical protein OS493_037075 [Desmophyllum pertusum]